MDYDVIIIGGGAAGLSGAITLARSRRTVLVIDSGEPRNAPADAVHAFLGHDGIAPRELLERGRAELAGFGGEFRSGEAHAVRRVDGGFDVDGTTARRLLVTTGLVDELPDVPGLRERWGHDVVHCPYCHGWEVRDRRIAVLAVGPLATHQALLFRQLSTDVVLLANGHYVPADERAKLDRRNIAVVEGNVERVVVEGDAITGVDVDGRTVACEVVAVGPAFRARSAMLESLGLGAVDFTMGEHVLGTHVPADPTGRTSVDGVFVAGNVTNPQGQVVHAAGAGVMAGAMINADLVQEEAASVG